ncbi:PilC/PilY family type IV pilus protein [Halioglobus pacificus]|nr:PilC/PilY family type IV pilus protein [Halioglobus pacificus]
MNVPTIAKRAKTVSLTLLATLWTLAPVWADDTEIFFSDTSGSGAIFPNVLFIVDTSGSMGESVEGTDNDRLEEVQKGFRELLMELSEVNVGLMRFSNPGGPVLFPVSNIDSSINALEDVELAVRIQSDGDDVQELEASGNVISDQQSLYLTSFPGELSRISKRINSRQDNPISNRDANQQVGGSLVIDNSDGLVLNGKSAGSPQLMGLRFNNVELPDNAVVTNARVQFRVQGVNVDQPVAVQISAATTNTSAFNQNNDIEERLRTTETRSWIQESGLASGESIFTSNFANVVNEVISRPEWDEDNDNLVVIFDPSQDSVSDTSGDLRLRSYESRDEERERPRLVIDWYQGPDVIEPGESATALKFNGLDIPRGVDITEAYIEFTSDTEQTGTFEFNITAEDDGTPAPLSDTNRDISSRSMLTTPITWQGDETLSVGDTYRTDDISALVEAVAGRSDWCGGNDMVFQVSGGNGARTAYSHDSEPSQSPRLVVKYDFGTIPNGTSCYRATVSRRIIASTDDIEDDGSVLRTGDILDFRNNNKVGLRFTDVPIPRGAEIYDARIELTQRSGNDTGATSLTVAAQASDDAETFSSSEDSIDARTYGASITFDETRDWDVSSNYKIPDPAGSATGGLVTQVQGVVDRAGWSSGNAMAFKVTTSGNDRRAYTFDSSPGQAARLIVEFQSNGAGANTRKVRDELVSIVDRLDHAGWTPVQDTMVEAISYYRGGNVLWGSRRGGGNGESGPHAYTRVSAPGAMVPGTFSIVNPEGCSADNQGAAACAGQTIQGLGSGGSAFYESPITDSCQRINHVILLTDGFANRDHSESLIKSFIGESSCEDQGEGGGGVCVQDLAAFVSDPNSADVSPLPGKQRIITHTVGFNFDSDWLRGVADAGGGTFVTANNAQQLKDAIKDILNKALLVDNTFVAPVAAVNQFNRLNNLNDIYFAVFKPEEIPEWPGNLKKYRLGENNLVLDSANKPAVDPDTGFFRDGSKDLWNITNSADGKEVVKGGAGSRIPAYTARNAYTYHSNSTTTKLSDSTNALSVDRIAPDGLTKDMFDAAALTDSEFEALIEWIRGRDGQNAASRYSFNDPLHSRPVAITYDADDPNDPSSQDVEIFLGTNGGGLHAFNASDGSETFVWFPEATLSIQDDLRSSKGPSHPYGIDGSIVPWVSNNGSPSISASEGDFVRLFFGMRRGGSNYYSLDVTDRSDPEFSWIIEGGAGDFSEMGQSWATPVRGRIKLLNQPVRDVLFIAGGYDPANDQETVRTPDSSGRAIYIVDAETGEKIWSGGPTDSFDGTFPDMQYSIPSGLTVADVDSDGLDDIIFVGDTGGQVWRFDVLKNQAVETLIKGGVVADLGVAIGDNTEVRNRRFFHAPDVALTERDEILELAVTIGSGYRPSPLSEVTQDAFFMLRQRSVFGPPVTYEKLNVDNLYDATDNRVGDGIDALGNPVSKVAARSNLEAKEGWYIDLHDASEPGEKVLSTPLTLDNTVTFVTYTPSDGLVDCQVVAGVSRVYAVNLDDATPAVNFLGTDPLDEDSRAFQLQTPSIIDEPVVICTGEGCDVFTGAEQPPLDALLNDRITRTYWRKEK